MITTNAGEIWWVVYCRSHCEKVIAAFVPGDVHGPDLGHSFKRDYLLKATRVNRIYENQVLDRILLDYPFQEVVDERTSKSEGSLGAASAA